MSDRGDVSKTTSRSPRWLNSHGGQGDAADQRPERASGLGASTPLLPICFHCPYLCARLLFPASFAILERQKRGGSALQPHRAGHRPLSSCLCVTPSCPRDTALVRVSTVSSLPAPLDVRLPVRDNGTRGVDCPSVRTLNY